MSESQSPEQIRADIERTRRDLGGDVDALADKVTPSKIVDRQKSKVRGAAASVKDRVFGVAEEVRDSAADSGSTLSEARGRVVARAEGNPVAVGLIAFGAGLLIASLLPASDKEKRAAAELREQAQPVIDEASDIAKDVGEHLRAPVHEATESVKETAAEAVDQVKASGQDAAQDVQGQARQSAERLTDR